MQKYVVIATKECLEHYGLARLWIAQYVRVKVLCI
jgi:hypothetical protein